MNTRQYLNQIKKYDKIIRNKLTEIYHLRTLATSITASNEGERVQTSSDHDKIGAIMAEIFDLEEETKEIVHTYIMKRKENKSTMEQVEDDNYYDVLFKKYVEYKSLVDIGEEMGYSISHIKRLHKNAVEEIRKLKGFQS